MKKIFAVAIVLAFMVPAIAGAQIATSTAPTRAQLQAQLNILIATVQQLQAQLAALIAAQQIATTTQPQATSTGEILATSTASSSQEITLGAPAPQATTSATSSFYSMCPAFEVNNTVTGFCYIPNQYVLPPNADGSCPVTPAPHPRFQISTKTIQSVFQHGVCVAPGYNPQYD